MMDIWFFDEKIEEAKSNKLKKLCYRMANNSDEWKTI